ncbi:MAG: GNAT family N-acetyltransferase [Desulfobacterales bacterium]|nr:GNAT family N-acetyltransferase [Desulfobacterales bacterium]
MTTSRRTGQLPLPFGDVFRGPPYRMDKSGTRIVRVATEQDLELIRTLFLEYARSLDFDLNFQRFDTEMETLPGNYATPRGLLLLAMDGETAAGCVAVRRYKPGICEMKRLYVRSKYRGRRIGRRLAEAVLEEAAKLGYRSMRLDTVPAMARALALYTDLGFEPIAAYCHNPIPGALFLECRLAPGERV